MAGNYSQFWTKTLEYGYNHKLGTKLSKSKQVNPLELFETSESKKSIPIHYDYREDTEVRDFLRSNPIRDQGECGASWAFSTIGTISCLQIIESIIYFLLNLRCCNRSFS